MPNDSTAKASTPPKPFKRKNAETDLACPTPVRGWSPSTVRTILNREIYHGVIVWNRSRKRNDWGKVDQKMRPESEWVRVPAEQLRIIDEQLWLRVKSRRQETTGRTIRFESGRISGRPPRHAAKNLLAGLAKCGVCGGGLVVETNSRGIGREREAEYICHRRRFYGTCTNKLHISSTR